STTSRAYWVTGSLAAFRLATAPELLVLVALVLLAGQSQPHTGRRAQAEFGQVSPEARTVVPQDLVQRVLAGKTPLVNGGNPLFINPLGRLNGQSVVKQCHREGRAVNGRQEPQALQLRGKLVPLSPCLLGQPVRAGRRHRLRLGFCFGQGATARIAGQHFQVRWFWFASTNSHGAHPLSSLHALWKLGEFRAGASAAAGAPRSATPGRISPPYPRLPPAHRTTAWRARSKACARYNVLSAAILHRLNRESSPLRAASHVTAYTSHTSPSRSTKAPAHRDRAA